LQAELLPEKGLRPLDPSTDLLAFLKPHPTRGNSPDHAGSRPGGATIGASSDDPRPSWTEVVQAAQPALRSAWRINLVNLDFRAVTLITVLAMLAIGLFVAAVLPPLNQRTQETDAVEFALVTLLTTIFSPLSFNYAYIWLFYPTTLALHRVLSEAAGAAGHRLKVAWLGAVLFIPALAIPFPQYAQAYGNLFVPALLLVFGLGAMLSAVGRRDRNPTDSGIVFFRGLANNAASPGRTSSAKECGGWTAHRP
jgi:hypothetical protein